MGVLFSVYIVLFMYTYKASLCRRLGILCMCLCVGCCALVSEHYGIGVNLNNFSLGACDQCESFFLCSVYKSLLSKDDTAFYGHAKAEDFLFVGIYVKSHTCFLAFCWGHEFADFLNYIFVHRYLVLFSSATAGSPYISCISANRLASVTSRRSPFLHPLAMRRVGQVLLS